MSSQSLFIPSRSRLAAALVLLAATGAAIAGPSATRSTGAEHKGPVRCELEAMQRGGSVELTALAFADKATRGEYDFRVSGRGTNIRQGGPFAVAAGSSERLGTVTLAGRASLYDTALSIRVDGRTIRCSDSVGKRI